MYIYDMRFYCSNQQIEHLRGSHSNSSFELSTLFGSFHCAGGSALQAVNVSEGLGRATNLFLEVQGSVQLVNPTCRATSSHLKSQSYHILNHFVKVAVLRFKVVQPAKPCKAQANWLARMLLLFPAVHRALSAGHASLVISRALWGQICHDLLKLYYLYSCKKM